MAELSGQNILIKADASYEIGTGHVMRMAVLAQALISKGAAVKFISRAFPGNLNEYLRYNGIPLVELPENPSWILQADDTMSWLGATIEDDVSQTFSKGSFDIAVIDHYGIDLDWCQRARMHAEKIICIDDEAIRALDCDILVNQNYFPNGETTFLQNLPVYCKRLIGPRYALLRPEFFTARNNVKPRTELKKILILLGGRDVHAIGNRVAEALDYYPDISMTFIGGDLYLAELCQKKGYRFLDKSDDIAAEMQKTDFCIGAAGSTTWERCCLMLPSALFVLAENQKFISQNLDSAGVSINLGSFKDYNFQEINQLLQSLKKSPERLESMSRKSGALVDGLGIQRIIEEIEA